MKNMWIAPLAAALAFAGSAHAAQFVVNGDFSQLTNGLGQLNYNTVATGWTVPSGGYSFVMNVADVGSSGEYGGLSLWDHANGGTSNWNGQSPTGGNYVAIDGDFQQEPLQQTITGLIAGKTYDLSFSYAFAQQDGFDGDTVQHIGYAFADASTDFTNAANYTNTADYNLPSHGFSGWSTLNTTVTATGTSDVLSFLAYGNLPVPPFALITDASLTGSVPETATWAMMILGLGAIGVVARRRRTLAAA